MGLPFSDPHEPAPRLALLRYALFAVAWLGLAGWLGPRLPAAPLWLALACSVLFALPLFLAGMYAATIRRVRRSLLFTERGLLYRLSTGRLLPLFGWALWSLACAFLMLLHLGMARPLDWLLLSLAVPLYPLLQRLLAPAGERELRPFLRAQASAAGARWLSALGLSLASALLLLGTESVGQASLQDSIAVARAAADAKSSSQLVQQGTWLVAGFRGLQQYALANLSLADGRLAALYLLLAEFTLFYNIALGLSCFNLPGRELRRLVLPVGDSDQPPAPAPRDIALASAAGAFLLGFVLLPLAAYLELWLQANPQQVQRAQLGEQRAVVAVERIGERLYRQGTVRQLQEARDRALAALARSADGLGPEADRAYAVMAGNVEAYLDWYYSLPAEYARIFALMTGSIEEMMAEELRRHLARGDAFEQLANSVSAVLAQQQALIERHRESVETILAEGELDPDRAVGDVQVVDFSSPAVLLAAPRHSGLSSVQGRLLTAGGAGAAVTGVIAAKVTAKVVGKGTIKMGAKALAKVASSKASGALGGSAAGAAAGAALGSVVPGVGTVAGGIFGGIVGGLAVGLTVEQLLLMLEEAVSRDDFEAQILAAIEEARLEFQASLQAQS